jgi:hypothetical protein
MKKIAALGAIGAIWLTVSGSLSLAATTRESVMHKCNAQTLKHVRVGGMNYEHRRALVWKDCMVSHGQKP